LISIVIPNYNGLEHLKTCYESLKKQTYKDFRLVLVDNGSKDNSVQYSHDTFPDAALILLDHNSGFAEAVNYGIKYTLDRIGAEYILLLNNDIELSPDFLEKGLQAFEKTPDASMVAVKMMNYFQRDMIDDCGDFIKKNGGSPYARGHGEKDTGQYDKEEYIFGACGGAAFYKSPVFKKVGLFDESFFAYYEDIDFNFRFQLFGFKCFYEPAAICYHKRGGTSSVATHGFQTEMCERNLVLMRIKNYPLSLYLLYQPLFFIARVKRYYSFIKFHSFKIFLSGFWGYIRGSFLMWTKIGDRYRIQRKKKVSTSYIQRIFVK
jgi:GT2 family glycosyltransferase